MAKAETKLEELRESNPHVINRSTQSLAAQSGGWRMLKWQTIKELGNKSYKIAIVVLLIVLGYKELAVRFLGVPADASPKEVNSATENPSKQ